MVNLAPVAPASLAVEFSAKGYVVCKGMFSGTEAAALIRDIQAAETIDGVSALNKGPMKFYSGVYSKSEALQSTISQPKVIDFLKQIIGPNFWVRWDQAVAKGSGAGTFPWHQDNAYNSLKDEHFQFWIALTKTTPENGGLWIVPGSHKRPLPHKQVGNHMVYQGSIKEPVFIGAEPGDVVLFSSYALHSTTPNTTDDTRWAYVVEYMSSSHYDPGIKAPYFMVARAGQPVSESVYYYRGNLNPLNHLKYWRWQLSKLLRR